MGTPHARLATFLDSQVDAKVAPGLIAVAFSRDSGITATASAGQRGSADPSEGKMDVDTTVWMASMSKAVSSIAALILVERHGVSLDSNDALSAILPELKLGNGQETDFIFDGKDENGKWKTKKATVGVTLRHLLLHVSGFGYDFVNEAIQDLHEPIGTKPTLLSGATAAYSTPRLFEAGTAWNYGCSTDWVGRFIERLSGLTLRDAYQTLVFDPLGIAADTLSVFRTVKLDENKSSMSAKVGDGRFISIPFDTPQHDGVPPEGSAPVASAPLWGTLSAYATFIESFLCESAPSPRTASSSPASIAKPLISKALWDEASSDGLAKLGISIKAPMLRSTNPALTNDMDTYLPAATPAGEALGEGWTMLQTFYNRRESASGLSVGTLAWAGLANSYFFVDPAAGVGGVILAQFLPFADPGMLAARDKFTQLVYKF